MSNWNMPGDIFEENKLLNKHKVEFKPKDKYCFLIVLETGLIVEVCAYPEGDSIVSTDITLKETEDGGFIGT